MRKTPATRPWRSSPPTPPWRRWSTAWGARPSAASTTGPGFSPSGTTCASEPSDASWRPLPALRDTVVGYRGDPERLDRRSTSPPPEAPGAVGAEEARWAVESARRVIAEFHRAAGRDAPGWV